MTRRWALALCALATLSLAACEEDSQNQVGPAGGGNLSRYVAIGTSISMGVQSDGVNYTTQVKAWPALLARQAMQPFTQPLLQTPGCPAPLVSPLSFGRRLNRLGAGADTSCAGLLPGISLPANDVAIDGATTYDALYTTPESTTANLTRVKRRKQYPLVLPPGRTQVTAMLQQDPSFVSVELGANEVLGAATSGRLVAGTTFLPYAVWQPLYDAVIDSVETTGARVLLVTVPDVSSIVSLRRGSEIFAQAAALQPNGVIVSADCNTAPGADNLIFVPSKVLGLIARAAALSAPQTLSCASTGSATTDDNVLDATEIATLAGTVEQMNAHIADIAEANGWALLDANAVLGVFVSENPAFSVRTLLTCAFPFGQYISFDGVHPNGFGHQMVANAAAAAINETYGWEIPSNPVAAIPAAQQCP